MRDGVQLISSEWHPLPRLQLFWWLLHGVLLLGAPLRLAQNLMLDADTWALALFICWHEQMSIRARILNQGLINVDSTNNLSARIIYLRVLKLRDGLLQWFHVLHTVTCSLHYTLLIEAECDTEKWLRQGFLHRLLLEVDWVLREIWLWLLNKLAGMGGCWRCINQGVLERYATILLVLQISLRLAGTHHMILEQRIQLLALVLITESHVNRLWALLLEEMLAST